MDDEVLENSETFSLDLISLSPVLGVLGDYETLTVSIEDNEREYIYIPKHTQFLFLKIHFWNKRD